MTLSHDDNGYLLPQILEVSIRILSCTPRKGTIPSSLRCSPIPVDSLYLCAHRSDRGSKWNSSRPTQTIHSIAVKVDWVAVKKRTILVLFLQRSRILINSNCGFSTQLCSVAVRSSVPNHTYPHDSPRLGRGIIRKKLER